MPTFWRKWGPALFVGVCCIAFPVAMWWVVNHSSHPPLQSEAIERADQSLQGKSKPVSADERIADYTAVLAWLIGVLAVVSALQIYFLNRADKTARIAANSARDASEAASRTVKTMERTAERQLRAYVHVSGAKIFDVGKPDVRTAQVSVRNCGQTPAYNMRFWVGIGVREFPLSTTLEPPPAPFPMESDVLPPGTPSVMKVPVPRLNAWEEGHLQSGDAAIYVYGRVTYMDVFNVSRRTDVLYMCHGEGLPTGSMSPYRKGNAAT